MKRWEFIGLVGGCVGFPIFARAQRALPVVGVLSSGSQRAYAGFMTAFYHGLADANFFEGRNVAFESRWADGQFDQLPTFAADLVHRQVAVIVATGLGSAVVAKAATQTIPLVFLGADDPVRFGLVASLSRPGGNATGLNVLTSELVSKRLALARELVPRVPIAVLTNPTSPEAPLQIRDMQSAAGSTSQPLLFVNVANEQDFDAAIGEARQKAGVLIVSNDAYFNSRRDQLVRFAAKHRLPAIYDRREYAAEGGLISYGTHYMDAYRRLGDYTARILKGTKPADLPVEQVTRFELVLNMKTADSLGLTIPPAIQISADEVIE